MMREVIGHQNSYLTVIVVHSTMHLMHRNDCQLTIICGHTLITITSLFFLYACRMVSHLSV